MVGLHWQGRFIVLSSLHHRMTWQVAPWGAWSMMASSHRYRVRLQGQTQRPSVPVRVPTLQGLAWGCWDTTQGDLEVTVWARSSSGSETCILQATSALAGLEVGGQGWDQAWTFPP
jgi:tocopherol cyclase